MLDLDPYKAIMHHDDACDLIVPSDIRLLVGEIERLRNLLKERETLMYNRECANDRAWRESGRGAV